MFGSVHSKALVAEAHRSRGGAGTPGRPSGAPSCPAGRSRHFERRVPAVASAGRATDCGVQAPDLLGRFQKVKLKSADLQGFYDPLLPGCDTRRRRAERPLKPHCRAVLRAVQVESRGRMYVDIRSDIRGFGHTSPSVPSLAGGRFELRSRASVLPGQGHPDANLRQDLRHRGTAAALAAGLDLLTAVLTPPGGAHPEKAMRVAGHCAEHRRRIVAVVSAKAESNPWSAPRSGTAILIAP